MHLIGRHRALQGDVALQQKLSQVQFFQPFNVLAEPPALAPMRHQQTDSIQMNRGCDFPHRAEVSLNAGFKFKTIANKTDRKC